MNINVDPKGMIERPDGSLIHYDKLPPEKQIAHDLVHRLCAEAEAHSTTLATFKRMALSEMIAARVMMMEDHGVKVGGKEGNMTLRTACGRLMAKMTVSKHVSFGPELEAAKALIFEVVEDELAKGGSHFIREIVEDVFSLNAKGRIDTKGIMNLRADKYAKELNDPRWDRAMEAIEDAICRDTANTYINFYRVDPSAKVRGDAETRIILDMAKV